MKTKERKEEAKQSSAKYVPPKMGSALSKEDKARQKVERKK